jgi:Fic/DOC family
MAGLPDFLGHLGEIERECYNLSRTAKSGELSTESSAHKVRHIRSGVSAETARTTGKGNVREAVRYLAAARWPLGDGVADLVVSVNRKLTSGVSTSPGAFRDFDSERFPYLSARLIPEFFDEFVTFLAETLASRDSSAAESAAVAARVHWDVNVHGHVFADGCGRTATVVAAWAYWLGQGVIPRLPPRGDYLSLAGAGSRAEFTRALAARISA